MDIYDKDTTPTISIKVTIDKITWQWSDSSQHNGYWSDTKTIMYTQDLDQIDLQKVVNAINGWQ